MNNKINSIDKFLGFVIILFGLTPIIPGSNKGILIAILFLLSIISFIKTKNKKVDFKTFLINSILYIFYVISLLYTSNISKGFKIIFETRLTAFLIPLIFLLLSTNKRIYTKEILNKFKKAFIFSTLLLCIAYLFYLPIMDRPADPFFNFPNVYFFRNGIINLPIFGLDPIYFSLYLGVSIIFISTILNKRKFFDKYTFFLIIFLIVLMVISSKMSIIALFLLIIITQFKKIKINFLKGTILIFSTISLIFLLFLIPTINSRAKELFKKETFTKYNKNNSTSIRISILKCGFEVSSKNILLGVGVGDVKQELINCYENTSNDLVYNRYNSHNQYLSVLISSGFLGLLFFLYFLYYNLKLSNLVIDKSFFYLLIFYSINFFSENVLERQNGVILFYFLICYFSHWSLHNMKRI